MIIIHKQTHTHTRGSHSHRYKRLRHWLFRLGIGSSGLYLVQCGVHLEDGAEVHGADVVERAGHELADDESVGAFRGVVGVPEDVLAPVGAEVGRRRAQPQPVVGALAAARLLGRGEAERGRVADEVEVDAERVGRDEGAGAEPRVELVQDARQLRVEERRRAHQLRGALAVAAALRQDRRRAPERTRARHQHAAATHRVQPLHAGLPIITYYIYML